jgi:hypothetical protein
MDKQKQEKQLELPNIEIGFYEYITKDTISFPGSKLINIILKQKTAITTHKKTNLSK